MKYLNFLCLLFIISCRESSKREYNFSKSIFDNDSGYITKKKAVLLITKLFKDSISLSYNQIPNNDTIGKYYTSALTGNIIACIIDPIAESNWNAHLLIEVVRTKRKDSIVANAHFFHNNRPCCWENIDAGFKQLNNYFYFKLCGTGSGYCSSKMYLFKTVIPQSRQNDIAETIHSQSLEQSQDLTSEMELYDNRVRMNYTLESNLYRDPTKQIVKTTKNFTVNYIWQNDQWVADDSTNLRDLDY